MYCKGREEICHIISYNVQIVSVTNSPKVMSAISCGQRDSARWGSVPLVFKVARQVRRTCVGNPRIPSKTMFDYVSIIWVHMVFQVFHWLCCCASARIGNLQSSVTDSHAPYTSSFPQSSNAAKSNTLLWSIFFKLYRTLFNCTVTCSWLSFMSYTLSMQTGVDRETGRPWQTNVEWKYSSAMYRSCHTMICHIGSVGMGESWNPGWLVPFKVPISVIWIVSNGKW